MSSRASAQEPQPTLAQLYHTAWTTREGAPADVFALAQTSDGFLWLGTGSGLFRFDGVRFELYEPPSPGAAASTNISTLLALRDGGLWIGYRFGGAALIHGGVVRSYGPDDGLPRGTVHSLVEDADGAIWLGATGGLARLDKGAWRTIGADDGFPGGQVTSILADRSGRLWVSAADGVFRRRRGEHRFERVAGTLYPSVKARGQSWLREAADGAIWASSAEGLRVLASAGAGRVEPESWLVTGQMEALLIDRAGAIWVSRGTKGGIERFSLHALPGARERTPSEKFTEGFASEVVIALLEDREGNVWAGTTGGLHQFRRPKLTRVELPAMDTAAPAFTGFALAPADSGGIWVGGGTGGRYLMRVGSRIQEFPAVRNPLEVAYRDREGVTWLGGPQGLWRSHGRGFKQVPLPEVENLGVQAVARDASGDVWISLVRNGVYRMTGERWVPFGDLAGLPREPAVVLTADDSGRTWFGYTAKRVAVLDGGQVRLYTGADGLSVGTVLSIHVHGPHVWVGGELGLALLAGGRFRSVMGKNGVAFRGTSGIVERPNGEVWLHGSIGITRIPAVEIGRVLRDSTHQVENERLDFRDGLEGAAQQIRPQPTLVQGTDGRLWFATNLNVAWLDPDAVPRNQTPPPVVIRRLIAGNQSYSLQPNLELPVHTTALRIDYTALSLSVPERVRFRYQLTGTDQGWQDVGGRREAIYTNLRPGSYRFRVIAANEDGVWNETGASFGFTIPPSFTQSRWFMAVWIAALGGLFWLLYLARMRQVAGGLRARYEAALAERTRIAQELHDTLLQGFTGITLQLRAIQRLLVQRPREGAEALNGVLASADTALRDARHAIWDMRAVELEGRDLVAALESAARSAMAGSSANLVFNAQGESRRLSLPVETTALRVGREAVLNAVKHAAPRKVEVALEYGLESLTLRVSDDGQGIAPGAIDAAARGEHWGLAGMRDRARGAGGTLEISSDPGRGTTVSLSLPINNSAN